MLILRHFFIRRTLLWSYLDIFCILTPLYCICMSYFYTFPSTSTYTNMLQYCQKKSQHFLKILRLQFSVKSTCSGGVCLGGGEFIILRGEWEFTDRCRVTRLCFPCWTLASLYLRELHVRVLDFLTSKIGLQLLF